MVRVRCPRCASVIDVTGARPVCPTCGFTGAAPQPPAAGAPQAPPAPAPEPAPATQAPPPAGAAPPAPAERSRTAFWVVLIIAIILLLGGVAAAILYYGPGLPGANAAGAVTEQEMLASFAQFGLLSGGRGDAFGFEGNADTPDGENLTFRMIWNPDAQASETTVTVRGSGTTFEYSKLQKGTVINYVLGDQVHVGRDLDPSTLPAPMEDTDVSEDVPDVADVAFAEVTQETFKGRPVTRFHGTNETGEVDVWVFNDDRTLAKVRSVQPDGTAVIVPLYGSELAVQTRTDSDRRASFTVSSEVTFEFSGDWRWDNATVDANHTEEVDLDDVEVRALQGFGDDAPVVFGLPARDAMGANETSLEAWYDDVDADGRLSTGDRYGISYNATAAEEFLVLKLYDTWADAYEGGPVPGPGAWIVLLAGLVAAAVGRARRGRR